MLKHKMTVGNAEISALPAENCGIFGIIFCGKKPQNLCCQLIVFCQILVYYKIYHLI